MPVFTLVTTMQYETVQKPTFLPERQESEPICKLFQNGTAANNTVNRGKKIRAISSEKSAKLTIRSDFAIAPSQGSKPYTSNSDAVPT